MNELGIIIPTKDEATTIGKLLLEIDKQKDNFPEENWIITIVDDSNNDETIKQAEKQNTKLNIPIQIIKGRNQGLAQAVIYGWQKTPASHWLVMDADLSHPPASLLNLLENKDQFDLIIGSRLLPQGKVENWPVTRKLMSWLATLAAKLLLTKKISDPMSGFFLVKSNKVDFTVLNPIGYKILLEIMIKNDISSVAEVPYTFSNRQYGHSKINSLITLQYFFHLLKLFYWKITH